MRIERLPNGFTRVDDRESGLVGMYDSKTGELVSGQLPYKNMGDIPPEAPFVPGAGSRDRFSAHAGGRLSGRSEHHGIHMSEKAAREAIEDLRNVGIPTRVVRKKSLGEALVNSKKSKQREVLSTALSRRATDKMNKRSGR